MAETETRPRRLPPEIETLTIFLEMRLRRDVGTSRDRLETETTTLQTHLRFDGRHKAEVTSVPRLVFVVSKFVRTNVQLILPKTSRLQIYLT